MQIDVPDPFGTELTGAPLRTLPMHCLTCTCELHASEETGAPGEFLRPRAAPHSGAARRKCAGSTGMPPTLTVPSMYPSSPLKRRGGRILHK